MWWTVTVSFLGYGGEVATAGGEHDAKECSTCHPSRIDSICRGIFIDDVNSSCLTVVAGKLRLIYSSYDWDGKIL